MEKTAAETFSEKLSSEMKSWKAIELRVRSEIEDHTGAYSGGEPTSGLVESHDIETDAGERFSEHLLKPANGKERSSVSFCDGSRYAHVMHEKGRGSRQTQVILAPAFLDEDKVGSTDRPGPFKYYHVDSRPLHRVLPEATSLGVDEVLGRPCDVFLLSRVRWGPGPVDLAYTLDRETATPLRVVCYPDAAAREQRKPSWVWEATSLDRVDGHPFVMNSELNAYQYPQAGISSEGSLTPYSTFVFTVEELSFDKSYPASTFWPEIQPGVPVWDQVGKTHWVTPDPERDFRRVDPATVTPAVAAVPPRDWSDLTSVGAIGLGLALLVGVVFWKRRGR